MRTAIIIGGPLDGTLISRDRPGQWPTYLDDQTGQQISTSRGTRCTFWRRGDCYYRQHYGAGVVYYLHTSLRGQEGEVARRLEQEAADACWLLELQSDGSR